MSLTLQHQRPLAQIAFFVLFVLTPVFDLFRYDLTRNHAYFLTMEWHLGIDDFIAGRIGALHAAGSQFATGEGICSEAISANCGCAHVNVFLQIKA